jgi:hypothetical protein
MEDSEVVENTTKRAGKPRVKPRHLTPILRRMIVEQFTARQSSEDVAEELGIPVRTVTDVVLLEVARKGPVMQQLRPFMVKQAA